MLLYVVILYYVVICYLLLSCVKINYFHSHCHVADKNFKIKQDFLLNFIPPPPPKKNALIVVVVVC